MANRGSRTPCGCVVCMRARRARRRPPRTVMAGEICRCVGFLQKASVKFPMRGRVVAGQDWRVSQRTHRCAGSGCVLHRGVATLHAAGHYGSGRPRSMIWTRARGQGVSSNHVAVVFGVPRSRGVGGSRMDAWLGQLAAYDPCTPCRVRRNSMPVDTSQVTHGAAVIRFARSTRAGSGDRALACRRVSS